jgi:hypothetical protein
MSATITMSRSGYGAILKINIQPSRSKALLACLNAQLSVPSLAPDPSTYKPFTVPLLLKCVTNTRLPPILVYYSYRYEIHYFYVPQSTVTSANNSQRYECPLPFKWDAEANEGRNFNFGDENTVILYNSYYVTCNTNLKDFMSVFDLNN